MISPFSGCFPLTDFEGSISSSLDRVSNRGHERPSGSDQGGSTALAAVDYRGHAHGPDRYRVRGPLQLVLLSPWQEQVRVSAFFSLLLFVLRGGYAYGLLCVGIRFLRLLPCVRLPLCLFYSVNRDYASIDQRI